MKWTDDQKEIFKHLLPKKDLLFLKTSCQLKVSLKHYQLTEYDYLVVSSDFHEYYIICEAKLHIGQQGISLDSAKEIIRNNETGVVSKRIGNNNLYEKCIVFPWDSETKICKNIDYWFNNVNPINQKDGMVYAYYDKEKQSIKAVKTD